MPATPRAVNPSGPPAGPAADFLAEAAALAVRRGELLAELWSALAGPLTLVEVLVRRDLVNVDAALAKLAGDSRAVLAVAQLAGRVAKLEAAAAGAGVA